MELFKNIFDFVFNFFQPDVSNNNPMITLCEIFGFGIALGLISLFMKMVGTVKQAGLFG